MRWIVRPSDPECDLESVTGGKASSLVRLQRLGARVPPFLVISAQAYREMGEGAPTGELRDELSAMLDELNCQGGLAVRSSAIGEDAADASFAGLYHTSLEVIGLDAVEEAVRQCWASYRNPAAAEYRREKAADSDGAMAVVLQEMIHGDWSGVCFTANPVSQALSEGLINAAPGLGEALVAG